MELGGIRYMSRFLLNVRWLASYERSDKGDVSASTLAREKGDYGSLKCRPLIK